MTTWTCVRCGRPADESRLQATTVREFMLGRCLGRCQGVWVVFRSSAEAAAWSGETLKQRGMAAVETAEAIGGTWVDRADAAIAQLAQRGTPFSAEDVARIAGRPDHPNAVGARMNAAARRGVIEWTGEIVTANRPERHASALRLWRGAAA